MPNIVLTNAFVSINAVDVSDHVRGVTVDYKKEMKDDTVMGDTSKSVIAGLEDWSIKVDFVQDWADNNIDEQLFALVGVNTALIVRPVKSSVVSASNPEYRGTGILEGYSPVGNAVGDVAEVSGTWVSTGGSLLRAIA